MKKVFVLFLSLFLAVSLIAVPATPEPVTVTYEDGRSLTYFVRGDENINWLETTDGYQIRSTQDGKFEYVQKSLLKSAGSEVIIAHDPIYRDSEESAFVSQLSKELVLSKVSPDKMKMGAPITSPFDQTSFPTLGSRKFLAILVDFPDLAFSHTREDFDSLFNAKDYTYNNAIGSVNEYYRTTSFEQFDPTFDVVGPFTVDSGYAYYGSNDEENIQKFVLHAILAADDSVDFSDYDLDNDGYVDNVYFIYAGYGEASGAPEATIWPHRWAYFETNLVVDGKRVWDYSTSNELLGTSGTTRTSIGVICHEFGHVCGLPDFYDTDYSESGGNCGGLGAWDEMAGGSWNDGGRRPPIFNAWSRMYLRWATPIELTGTQSITLDSAYTQNEVYYFMSPTNGEFFMMENRQQVGFDKYIPGHGMLIFHIDMNHPGWNNNSLNVNPGKQGFDLEEADGYGNITSSYINAGDAFPGTSNNTYFMDNGSPNAQDWAGNPSRSPILNIQETAGVITFNFGGENIEAPTNFTALAQGYDSVRVAWDLNSRSDSVMLVWTTSTFSGFPEVMQKYDVGDNVVGGEVVYKGIDTMFYHTGLQAGTTHYYRLYAFNDSAYTYSEKISGLAKTASPAFYTTDFSQGLPEGWVAYDRYGNGSFSPDNPESRSIASTTASNGFITMDSEHIGNKLVDAELITQSFNFALARSVIVKFQHKLEVKSTTLARLLYTINDGLSWMEVKRWSANTSDPEVEVLDISAELWGFRDVKFKFSYIGNNEKYWCIDDFEIEAAQDTGLSAGFHTGTVSGSKPLTVAFMNTTVNGPDTVDTWLWDFGADDATSTEKEPVFTYVESGSYSVSLTASKNGKTSDFSRSNYIEVTNDAPVVIYPSDTLDVAKSTPATYNLNRIFMDPNGDPMTFSWSGNSESLDLYVQDDSLLVITPFLTYMGMETVTLVAKDNENDSTAHDFDIWISETGVNDMAPSEFNLSQNYPNPFNPVTAIAYQLPVSGIVNLSVYDLSGHKVRTLVNGYMESGYYTLPFYAGDLASGVYLYRMTAGDALVTKKMVLMK